MHPPNPILAKAYERVKHAKDEYKQASAAFEHCDAERQHALDLAAKMCDELGKNPANEALRKSFIAQTDHLGAITKKYEQLSDKVEEAYKTFAAAAHNYNAMAEKFH